MLTSIYSPGMPTSCTEVTSIRSSTRWNVPQPQNQTEHKTRSTSTKAVQSQKKPKLEGLIIKIELKLHSKIEMD
jgi:hypothetical protein